MNYKLSAAAQACVDETGCDFWDDVDDLREGNHTKASLLTFCLDGAEPDRIQGWHEYVEEVYQSSIKNR